MNVFFRYATTIIGAVAFNYGSVSASTRTTDVGMGAYVSDLYSSKFP